MKTTSCPSCGAAITFRSAVSILTVCPYCQSTLIRHDLELENIGRMAELLPDSSPIQLGVAGVYRKVRFTVVGRIQLRYGQGLWNEWHLLFDNQRSGWLGEPLGNYAVTFLIHPPEPLPAFADLRAGQSVILKGHPYQVTNIESARCIAGEGELPIRVGPGYDAPVVDLQSAGQRFATLDYSETPPLVFVGEQVAFNDLQLTGLREVPPAGWETDASVQAQSCQCSGCGSALTLRASGFSETVACGVCGAILDLTDPNLRILSQFQARITHEPLIPLGAHGTLEGTDYQAIGYLRRRISVDGVDYEWSEYLLFHRAQGFRWLVEYNGHWSLVHTLSEPPQIAGFGAAASAVYQDQRYRHFQTAEAEVCYVLGEFYWRVQVGERCAVSDYIAPPLQLSQERSDREIVWSQAEYLEPAALKSAFRLDAPLPVKVGIAPNQPSPYAAQWPKLRRTLWAFIGLLIVGQIVTVLLSSHQQAHQQTFAFNAAAPSQTSDAFALSGRPSNLVIRAETSLSNQWVYFDMALINRETGDRYAISRELGYYHGFEDGEHWSEGSASDEAVLSAIPAGLYHLSVDAEQPPAAPTVTATFTLTRDAPSWSNFLLALLGLLIAPGLFYWRARAFERSRWADSDHGPSGAGAAENDD